MAGEFTTNLGLMELLDKYGPMIVSINAEENTGFMNYDSGIFAHPSRPKMCDPNKPSKMKIFNSSNRLNFICH